MNSAEPEQTAELLRMCRQIASESAKFQQLSEQKVERTRLSVNKLSQIESEATAGLNACEKMAGKRMS